MVNKSKWQPNKLWFVQRKVFYNSLIQKYLDANDILMYFTHNESKSVVAERFIRTSKGKVYKKLQLLVINFILVI